MTRPAPESEGHTETTHTVANCSAKRGPEVFGV